MRQLRAAVQEAFLSTVLMARLLALRRTSLQRHRLVRPWHRGLVSRCSRNIGNPSTRKQPRCNILTCRLRVQRQRNPHQQILQRCSRQHRWGRRTQYTIRASSSTCEPTLR